MNKLKGLIAILAFLSSVGCSDSTLDAKASDEEKLKIVAITIILVVGPALIPHL